MPRQRFLRRPLVPVLVSLTLLAPVLALTPAQAADRERSWDEVTRATTDPTSYVTIIGDHDEFVTDGTQRLWRPDQTIEVGGSADTTVVVRVGGDSSGSYRLIFSPPAGETLEVGHYPVAGGMPWQPGRAGIIASGEQRGCNEGDGSFTVHDITPDLSRLWLTYEFRCEDEVAGLRGEVRIDSPPSEPVTVLADGLHWRVSPPGRDYGTQPVFAINTGDAPIVLGPAEVSGDAFSLASDSCGVLLPGASCAVEVAFDPVTRGTETGHLRVPTSSASTPTIEVPLDGVGNVGITHVYSRQVAPDGRTFDTEMTADRGSFLAWADPSRVVIAFAHPDYVDERPNGRVLYDYVSFTAAPGDVLEAGRTYAATCSDRSGALVELPGACHSAATGSFVLDEFDLRADHTLARFRARGELTGVEAPVRTTTTVAWQADEDATPYAPFLALSGPSALSEPGNVQLAATYPTGHGITTVDLYAETAQGRVLVDTVTAYQAGRVPLWTYLWQDTVLVAEARTGDGVLLTSAPFAVAVDIPGGSAPDTGATSGRTVSLSLRAARPRAGAPHRTGTRTVAELRLRPREAGRCLRLQVQRRVDGGWVARSLSGCRRTDGHGVATTTLVTRPGTVLRARAVWAGDRRAPRSVSSWRQVRVGR